jgi:hypothetical protein
MIVSAGRAFDPVRFGAPPHQFLELVTAIVAQIFKDGHDSILILSIYSH